ncbi:hypothetical protein LTR62_006056 [Meristemomyces frigidus]|uniref:Luciferase domain-containing protein n=1 Tax=Meristemomyces frigidus TaxID=1508187 RepID=A0AAN7TNW1_9PEZI|nr:hypothetical protein LTR62_006056 [Meristemomyces frigidus]
MAEAQTMTSSQQPPTTISLQNSLSLLTSFSTLAILLPFLLYLHFDYLAFLSLGPGGTPSTLSGYIRVKLLACFALSDPYEPGLPPLRLQNQSGYLPSLSKRPGPRPCTRGIAPHRQVTQKSTPHLYSLLASAIEELGRSSDDLRIGTSCFEKNGTGLFSTSPAKRTCAGEVTHAHPSDGSMHLTLHPADAKVVLEAGWGERHPLARGGWFERFVPAGFVMVYAPVCEGDVGVVMGVVRAAASFVGGAEVPGERVMGP